MRLALAVACPVLLVVCNRPREVAAPDDEPGAGQETPAVAGGCEHVDCPSGQECVQGACEDVRAAAPEPCREDQQCRTGYVCEQDACVPGESAQTQPEEELQGILGLLGGGSPGDEDVFGYSADVEHGSDPSEDEWDQPGVWGVGAGLGAPGATGGGTGEGLQDLPGVTLAPAEPCQQDAECQAGEICSLGTCRSHDGAALGEACIEGADCAPLLECEGGVCTRRTAVGHRCQYEMDCGHAEHCILEACSATHQAPGQKCRAHEDCHLPQQAVSCRAGKCAVIDEQQAGEPGDPCLTELDCREGLLCGYAGCTQELSDHGQPCSMNDHCREQYICVAGACRGYALSEDAACEQDVDCTSQLCLAGRCRADLLPDGTPCWQSSDCDSGSCVMDRCAAQRVAEGGACDDDLDCELPLACIAGECRDSQSPEGGACDEHADCIWGLHCDEGECK
jgi:hypothetical protein